MYSDDKIINSVDGWEEERIQLTHRRRLFGMGGMFILGLLAILAVFQPRCSMACHEADRQEKEAERVEAEKREARSRRQEEAWQACLLSLGEKTCNEVESRLAERCLALMTRNEPGPMVRCLDYEIVP